MVGKVLITSALPYANGPLHFGHIAGAYLPADVYARFQRLQGEEVLFLSGSDEYGVAITLSAELAKRSPQEHVDHFHQINKDFFEKLGFSFDYFGRTTSSGHGKIVQEFFDALQKGGYIEEREVDQLYSEEEGRFLADRYVEGTCPKCGFDRARGDECPSCAASYEATDLKNPRSKLSQSPLTKKKTRHFYLRFDLFRDQLKSWIQEKRWKENVLHFAMRYIDDLKPRAITRDSSWGIPVQGVEGKVFYVWFDAPIGYLSIAQDWAISQGAPEKWKQFWCDPKTKLVQFLGKDNIPFHAVFFPAMLMGQDQEYKLPDELPANEFLLLEGRQFSKSEGWTIDLEAFFKKFSSDQARYALAANAPETSDAEFSWRDFQMRSNSELLGKFGNFVHRVFTFTKQHLGGKVPPQHTLGERDRLFLEEIDKDIDQMELYYETFSLRKVTSLLMDICSKANAYFDREKPWAVLKDPESRDRLETILFCSLECIRRLSLIASPILPDTSQKIWKMLGYRDLLSEGSWQKMRRSFIEEDQRLEDPVVLFRKIEDAEIEEEVLKLGQKEAPEIFAPLKGEIPFEAFDQLDIRVGQIIEAEKIAKSKKLLKLLVDFGFERRTIVSGISEHYKPEDLLGKKFLFIINLQPATILGIESQGMLLAGGGKTGLELPFVQNLPAGTSIS